MRLMVGRQADGLGNRQPSFQPTSPSAASARLVLCDRKLCLAGLSNATGVVLDTFSVGIGLPDQVGILCHLVVCRVIPAVPGWGALRTGLYRQKLMAIR